MVNMDYPEQELKLKVEEIIRDSGMHLIDLVVFSSASKVIVRCLIDYPQGGVTIDDCAGINQKIFSFLETTGLVGDDFVVEVNSPGLDRPLKLWRDFLRVKSRKVSLWLSKPFEGRSYIEAEVVDVNEDKLSLKVNDRFLKLPFSFIKIGKEKVEL
jgi:ribosome maturation factor RimP